MPSYVPVLPSGSTSGRLIQIANTSTTLHDSVQGSTHMDEVFVYVNNISAAAVVVTLEIEGTGVESQIIDSIPPQAGFVLMLPGMRCSDTTDIDAKAATTDVCNALVLVNRILITEGLDGS